MKKITPLVIMLSLVSCITFASNPPSTFENPPGEEKTPKPLEEPLNQSDFWFVALKVAIEITQENIDNFQAESNDKLNTCESISSDERDYILQSLSLEIRTMRNLLKIASAEIKNDKTADYEQFNTAKYLINLTNEIYYHLILGVEKVLGPEENTAPLPNL